MIFFFPGGDPRLKQASVPWHVLFGLFVYVLAVGTALLGFLEDLTFLEKSGLAKFSSQALLVNFTAVVTLFFGAFVVLSVVSRPNAPPPPDNNDYAPI